MLEQKCIKLKLSPSYFYHLELSMRINAFDQWYSIKSTRSRVVTLFFTYLLHASPETSHVIAWQFNLMFSMLVLCLEDPLRVLFDQYSNRHSCLCNWQAWMKGSIWSCFMKQSNCFYILVPSFNNLIYQAN